MSSATKFKQRIEEEHKSEAVGLEVHVDGWGTSPFFKVLKVVDDTIALTTRYSNRPKYHLPYKRIYFTKPSRKSYLERISTKCNPNTSPTCSR